MPNRTGLPAMMLCLTLAVGAASAAPSSSPYAGIKLTAATGPAKAVIRVQSDGKVIGKKTAAEEGAKSPEQERPIAKMADDAIVDTNGVVVLKLEADGGVSGRGLDKKMKFNASDELLGPDGSRMLWLAADGTPQMGMGGKTAPLPLKAEGVTAKNRRMALLLILRMWMPGEMSGAEK